jgi:hypothetical protein
MICFAKGNFRNNKYNIIRNNSSAHGVIEARPFYLKMTLQTTQISRLISQSIDGVYQDFKPY